MNKQKKEAQASRFEPFRHVIPEATLKRLVYYVRCVRRFRGQGRATVLSKEIGNRCGIKSAIVRKDFSYFGEFGVRGRGYDVEQLDRKLESLFDSVGNFRAILVGVGKLGHAIAGHASTPYKTRVIAAFDRDPEVVNMNAGDVPVYPMEDMEGVIRREEIICAILAIPPEEVQDVADRMVAAGVRIILSLALIPIRVPEGVTVAFLDILSEVEYLFFKHRLREENS